MAAYLKDEDVFGQINEYVESKLRKDYDISIIVDIIEIADDTVYLETNPDAIQ